MHLAFLWRERGKKRLRLPSIFCRPHFRWRCSSVSLLCLNVTSHALTPCTKYILHMHVQRRMMHKSAVLAIKRPFEKKEKAFLPFASNYVECNTAALDGGDDFFFLLHRRRHNLSWSLFLLLASESKAGQKQKSPLRRFLPAWICCSMCAQQHPKYTHCVCT